MKIFFYNGNEHPKSRLFLIMDLNNAMEINNENRF
jgi:hypothetical protein